MATLYEYYNAGDNTRLDTYEDRLWAQTFTPSLAHKITSVKLLIFKGKEAATGTLTVGIRATSDSHPTGSNLCSGTIEVNNLIYNISARWEEITLGAGYPLSASTKYAIVLAHPDGESEANYVGWRCDSSSPTYTGGCAELYEDTWSSETGYDFMFEEYGGITGELAGLYAVVEERFHYVDAYGTERYIQGTVV